LILNSPSNPTGGVLELKDLKQIACLARKFDFYILSDEIYSRMVYGNGFKKVKYNDHFLPIAPSLVTLPGMARRIVILDGFSKAYAMTGLRLGFACSRNQKIMDKFFTLAINLWSCLPQPLMAAAEAALDSNQKEVQAEMVFYQKKKEMAVKLLRKIDGITCHDPKGSFYLFPNVTEICRHLGFKNAENLRQYLLRYDRKNKKGVAVLTRDHFGKKLSCENQEYLRISFAGSMVDLRKGIKRIKEAIEKR